VLGAILLGAGTLTTFDQRLYTLRDDLALLNSGEPGTTSCTSSNSADASSQLTNVVFDLGAASIGVDDKVYAGAQQALIQAYFDGFAWDVKPATTLPIRVTGQPALMRSSTGATMAFVSGTDGRVDAIAFPGGHVAGFPVQASNSALFGALPPTIAEDGTITVGTDDGMIVSISTSGNLVRRSAAEKITTPPTHGTGGIVYVGTNTGISALRLQDGAVLWTFATRAPVKTPPALGCDGVLYFGDDSGTITALQTDSAGLADTPWPRGGHDVHGTGNSHHAVRGLDGSCVE
jgi:outer membrane protein assembly factor BamB